MPEQSHKTDDVFGIAREIPLNYVSRESADSRFIENLTRDKHLVVYGSSKQGKTCLRKHCLCDTDYITVHCSNRWDLDDLHTNILKRAGYEITLSSKKSVSGKKLLDAKVSGGVFGIGASAGTGQEESTEESTEVAALDLDPADVNDIIAALDKVGFEKYIVLEDFHYLPTDTQRDFAVSLKAFHESSSVCFIVIGVWLEENRLTVYNGDLTGRVASISADSWSDSELREVISAGEELLNVAFASEFVDELIQECQQSVYLVQETCHRACVQAGVFSTQDTTTTIGSGMSVLDTVKDVVNEQTGRYNSFLVQFADGFQTTDLQMYRWLLYPVLTSDLAELEKGLRYSAIRKSLESVHPKGTDLNAGNVTQALQSAAALQIKKDIKPTILDYDQTNLRLRVVDRGFPIWLRHQNRTELLERIDLPSATS